MLAATRDRVVRYLDGEELTNSGRLLFELDERRLQQQASTSVVVGRVFTHRRQRPVRPASRRQRRR